MCSPNPAASEQRIDDVNSIVVKGERRDRVQEKGPGQVTVVRPTKATDSQTMQALEEESALLPERSGSITASGSMVPRVRGQDARSTEVFLDGVKFQDNYTGFPLIEDIDLRALGSLAVSRGASNYKLPTTNQTGALNYRIPSSIKSEHRVGTSVGKPFGWSVFGISRGSSQNNLQHQIFYKHHETDGKFEFYDDNGTPYNSEDDRKSWRQDNQNLSDQILPLVRYQTGSNKFEYIAWMARGVNGIPSLGGHTRTYATRQRRSQIHLLKFEKEWNPVVVGVYGVYQSSTIQTDDPAAKVTVTGNRQSLKNSGKRVGINLSQENELIGSEVRYEHGSSNVESSGQSQTTLTRDAQAFFLGTRIGPERGINLQLKSDFIQFQDQERHQNVTRFGKGVGAVLGFYRNSYGTYIQSGQSDRVPGLLETFGDGGGVQGNPTLENEMTRHLELGGYLDLWSWLGFRGAFFQDVVTNKIVFVPLAAGDVIKAVNMRETELSGIEITMAASTIHWLTRHSATYLKGRDVSSSRHLELPGVPNWVYTGTIGLIHKPFSSDIHARYRSKVFKDINNTLESPPAWFFDWQVNYQGERFSTGLIIDNIFNTQAANVRSPETGEQGKTAVTEINGYPLPGRTWRIEFVANF